MTAGSPSRTCSISAWETPCLPHFSQLPSSQSNPAILCRDGRHLSTQLQRYWSQIVPIDFRLFIHHCTAGWPSVGVAGKREVENRYFFFRISRENDIASAVFHPRQILGCVACYGRASKREPNLFGDREKKEEKKRSDFIRLRSMRMKLR